MTQIMPHYRLAVCTHIDYSRTSQNKQKTFKKNFPLSKILNSLSTPWLPTSSVADLICEQPLTKGPESLVTTGRSVKTSPTNITVGQKIEYKVSCLLSYHLIFFLLNTYDLINIRFASAQYLADWTEIFISINTNWTNRVLY